MYLLWDKFILDNLKFKFDKIIIGLMIFIYVLCFVKVLKCLRYLKNVILKNKKNKIKLRYVWIY